MSPDGPGYGNSNRVKKFLKQKIETVKIDRHRVKPNKIKKDCREKIQYFSIHERNKQTDFLWVSADQQPPLSQLQGHSCAI